MIITNLFIRIYPMRGFFPLGIFWIPDSTIAIKKYYFLIFHKNTLESMIKKFSSPKMRNRQFVFAPKIQYKLVAESAKRADKLREASQNSLTFPVWSSRQESNLHY